MHNDVTLLKIESLQRCIERIRAKTPARVEGLTNDIDLQDIIVLNLQRAVQVSIDLAAHVLSGLNSRPPQTMAECFTLLHAAGVISAFSSERMRRAVGFRNIAVHEYQALDWTVIYAIITRHLEDFRQFAREIHAWTAQHDDDV